MAVKKDDPFVRWFLQFILKTEHFMNMIALLVVSTFMYMIVKERGVTDSFYLLVGSVIGYYFTKGDKS